MKQELIFAKDEQSFSAPVKIKDNFSVDDNFEVPDMFKSLELEKGKYFWGYANISTPDTFGDKFTLDALTQISQGLTIAPYNKIFLFHDYKDIAIGTIIYAMVDGFGLIILAKLNEAHQRAEETMASIMNGSLDGFSMAGNFIRVISEYDDETEQFVNLVLEATAKEVTLTSIPTHPGASVMGTFRKSMESIQNRFMKAFRNGKEINLKQSEKYKKDIAHNNSMDSDQDKKDVNVGTDSQDNKAADDSQNQDSNVDVNKDADSNVDADANKDTDKSNDSQDADKDSDDTDKGTDKDADADKKKDVDQDKASDADKIISDLKSKNSELEKEVADLKIKVAGYEKAMKMGYEKAMKEKEDKTKEPYRKSVKTSSDKHVSNKSNSTPMLNWLKK